MSSNDFCASSILNFGNFYVILRLTFNSSIRNGTIFWPEKLKERERSANLNVFRKIILKVFLRLRLEIIDRIYLTNYNIHSRSVVNVVMDFRVL